MHQYEPIIKEFSTKSKTKNSSFKRVFINFHKSGLFCIAFFPTGMYNKIIKEA